MGKYEQHREMVEILLNQNVKVIAHRGAFGITGEENTLKSFRTSWMMGCDMVEFDIRLCKSGEIVCFHDSKIDEIPIINLTLKEMKERSHSNIPTLEETILECKDNIILDVEIKETGYEKESLEILKKHLNTDTYVVTSFKTEVIKKIKALNENIQRGLILPHCERRKEEDFINHFTKEIHHCKPHFLAPNYKILKPWFLENEVFKKLPFLVWTVNTPKDMQKIIALNVEGIITDRPDYLFEVIRKLKKK